MRAFGNSIKFPWAKLTRDFDAAEGLQDCSLLFFEIEDDKVIDIINSFDPADLIFSRMAGDMPNISLTTCLISKHDILHCYDMYEKKQIND